MAAKVRYYLAFPKTPIGTVSYSTEEDAHAANKDISMKMYREGNGEVRLHGRYLGMILRVEGDSEPTVLYTDIDKDTLRQIRDEEAKKRYDYEKAVNNRLNSGRSWLQYSD